MKNKTYTTLKKEQKNIIKKEKNELCQTQNVPIYRGSLDDPIRREKGNDENSIKFLPLESASMCHP